MRWSRVSTLALMVGLVLAATLHATCTGLVANVWTDGVWNVVTFEVAATSRSTEVVVELTPLDEDVDVQVLENGEWVDAAPGEHHTSGVRAKNGDVEVRYAHAGCEEDLVLGDS